MGISKRELLQDYYLDEIGEIIHEYNALHKYDASGSKEASCENFFGF